MKVTVQFERQPLSIVFGYLMTKYEVPIGFEESILDQTHNDFDFETNLPLSAAKTLTTSNGDTDVIVTARRNHPVSNHFITLNIVNGRLDEVFNSIVRQMGNYQWQIADGVVNIFPKKGRDPRYEALLKMKVAGFTLKSGETIGSISQKLRSLPELKEFLTRNKLYFNPSRSGIDFLLSAQLDRTVPSQIKCANITFLDLLNKITNVKKGGWMIKKSDKYGTPTKEYIDIDI